MGWYWVAHYQLINVISHSRHQDLKICTVHTVCVLMNGFNACDLLDHGLDDDMKGNHGCFGRVLLDTKGFQLFS
jgi:hypothetical protein